MKIRKNIDHLYNERLKDFETIPREDVWKKIAARLPQNDKKKRIIPLWVRMTGAAAVIALLIGVGGNFLDPFGSENSYRPSSITFATTSEIKEKLIKSDVVFRDFNEYMSGSAILLESLMKNSAGEISNTDERVETRNSSSESSPAFSDIIAFPEEIVYNGSKYTFDDYNAEAFNEEQQIKENQKEQLTEKELNSLTLLASEEKQDQDPEDETRVVPTASQRLSVRTAAAAVYFDNLGTGSTFNNQFGNNKTNGEVSIAYGINLAYQISKRVKIRSGIYKVALSHNTQDVDFAAAVSAIAVNSNLPRYSHAVGEGDNQSVTLTSSKITGELNQEMGFFEVPIEIEYALIDKRIGFNIIGGASTLFLNDNMVTLNSPVSSNIIGEGNNLNTISFSTNIGLGLEYNLSQRFQWNLEPIFKYQLNTFNNAPGVKPYNFGIYSGFSFKF